MRQAFLPPVFSSARGGLCRACPGIAAICLLTTALYALPATAQSTQAEDPVYTNPLLPPISGTANTPGSRGEYIIPGTRPRTATGNALPSPKKLKRPEDLPSIRVPNEPYHGATRALPSTTAITTRPVYPTPPRLQATTVQSTVQDSTPAGDVTVTTTAIPVTPHSQNTASDVQTAIPFGKPSAPLTLEEKGIKTPVPLIPAAQPASIPAPVPAATMTPPIVKPVPVATPVVAPAPVTVAAPAPQLQTVATPEEALPWRQAPMQANATTPKVIAPEPLIVQPAEEIPPAPIPIAPMAAAPAIPEPVALPVPQTDPATGAQTISADDAASLIPPDIAAAPAVEAPVTAVVEVPAPELSEKSLQVLKHTPSGIDSPKQVVARSPKPVVIKREDPGAGNIPAVDVRAHEEMGLKIEVRRADPNAQEYLEQAYENLIAGRYEIAVGYYQEVLKLNKNNELGLFGLATTYQKMGRMDDARDQYAHLLSINPSHREALNNFMALIAEEAPQEAIAELLEMEKQNPDFSPIPAQLGVLYSKTGDYTQAAEKLARALNLSPENVSYKYNLAVALDRLGDRQKAAELYVELIEDYKAGASIPGDLDMIRNRIVFLSQKQP